MMGRKSETTQIRREKPPVVYNLDDYRQGLPDRPNDAEVTITRNQKVDLWTVQGGQTVPMHMHTNSECLLIVLAGHGEYQLGHQKFDIRKDMMAIAPPATPHAVINNNSDPLVVLTVEAPGPFDTEVIGPESRRRETFY
jgi:mannose-6-phosphate isomerase-like protein (cupin superfamily)